jgi:hypothetical protein
MSQKAKWLDRAFLPQRLWRKPLALIPCVSPVSRYFELSQSPSRKKGYATSRAAAQADLGWEITRSTCARGNLREQPLDAKEFLEPFGPRLSRTPGLVRPQAETMRPLRVHMQFR